MTTRLATAIHNAEVRASIATWPPQDQEPQQLARTLLIAAGADLAETMQDMRLPISVLTHRGDGDDPEDAQMWKASRVQPHLDAITNALANISQIIDAVDNLRFPAEPRMADMTIDQVTEMTCGLKENEVYRIFVENGLDGADEFLRYRYLPVASGGRVAVIKPDQPYRGAARAFIEALEMYCEGNSPKRFVRVARILSAALREQETNQ